MSRIRSLFESIAAAVADTLSAASRVIDFLLAKDVTSNASKQATSCIQSCPQKNNSITPAQAQQYMDDFAAQKENIPFDYPPDCCYARARVMCDKLKNDGVLCEKFWYGTNDQQDPLIPKTKDGKDVYFPPKPKATATQVMWSYHVAPLVPVSENGKVIKMVLDPSLSTTPLTISQWKDRAGRVSSSWEETTSAEKWASYFGGSNHTTTEAKKALEGHKLSREKGLK